MGTYKFTGGPLFVTVGTTGDYDIVAYGAQGGGDSKAAGGYGAEVGGTVHLTAGEKLEIVVGGQGGYGGNYSGGGGGGSFVLANIGGKYQPLLVAAGGGGASGSKQGGIGETTKSVGTRGAGQGGASGTESYSGAGGSGYNSNGQKGTGNNPTIGGKNRTGAYAGGYGYKTGGTGGFGGGGGGNDGGGGGGGYSGGTGGSTAGPGTGGGSYDSGTPMSSQTVAGENGGNGRIVFSSNVVSQTTVYDTTAQPSATNSSTGTINQEKGEGFSFTSSSIASGSLADLKLELRDATASTDGGSVSVQLYSNLPSSNLPNTLLANLGTINDSQLNADGTASLVDLPLSNGPALASGTRYWITLSASSGSMAKIDFTSGATGTGAAGEYEEFGGTSYSNSSGALIAQVTEAVCFASGTRIRIARGGASADAAVEDLRIGDLAVTSSGAFRPIRWLGHRTLDLRQHPRPHEVMPIRIAAHALGPNRPARDLRVSPGHAICVDLVGEVLIPAGALVNGATIVQEEVDTVTYWHVELEGGHDIVLAENLPCESYLDMGNRTFFAEGGVVDLHAVPDAAVPTHADFCRPFHADGPVVDFVRERLAARPAALGWRLEEGPLEGNLHLEVDGVRLEPEIRGLAARFLVPAGAKHVWLVSPTAVPAHSNQGPDLRALGVCVGAVTIDDGFGPPRVTHADEPSLCVGFHEIEAGPQRWTAGRARLPAALWNDCHGGVFLRVALTRPPLPRWVAPAVDADEIARAEPARGAAALFI